MFKEHTQKDLYNAKNYAKLYLKKATFIFLNELRPEIFSHLIYEEKYLDIGKKFYISEKLENILNIRKEKLVFNLFFTKHSCDKLSCYSFLKNNKKCESNSYQINWGSGNTIISSCQPACRLMFKSNNEKGNNGFDLFFKNNKCYFQNFLLKKFATDPDSRFNLEKNLNSSNLLPGFDFDEQSSQMSINKFYCNYYNQLFDKKLNDCYFSAGSKVSNFIFFKTLTALPTINEERSKGVFLDALHKKFVFNDELWMNDIIINKNLQLEFTLTGIINPNIIQYDFKKFHKKREIHDQTYDRSKTELFIHEIFDIIDSNIILNTITEFTIDFTLDYSLKKLRYLIKNKFLHLLNSKCFNILSKVSLNLSKNSFNFLIASTTTRITLLSLSNVASSVATKVLLLTSSALTVVGWGVFVGSILGFLIDLLWDPYEFDKQLSKQQLELITKIFNEQFKHFSGVSIHEKRDIEFTTDELLSLMIRDLTTSEKIKYDRFILNVCVSAAYEYLESLDYNSDNQKNNSSFSYIDFNIAYNYDIKKFLPLYKENEVKTEKSLFPKKFILFNTIITILNSFCFLFSLIIYQKNSRMSINFYSTFSLIYIVIFIFLYSIFHE